MQKTLITVILLWCSISSYSQSLLLLDIKNTNTDTLKVGNKIKMWFNSDRKIKMGQYLHWDNDSTTYYVESRIVAIDSCEIKIKKKGLTIPIANIYKVRRIKGWNRFAFLFTTNTILGVSSQFILPSYPFFSIQTLGSFVVADFIIRGLEPIIFPIRKLNKGRYQLAFLPIL